MIQMRTTLNVSDNSGAKLVRCIKISNASGKKAHAESGEVIVASVITTTSGSKIKAGQVVKGLIVRTKSPRRRPDASSVIFDDNAVVLIDKDGEPIGTRVFGPISREVKQLGFLKVSSLAPEVV